MTAAEVEALAKLHELVDAQVQLLADHEARIAALEGVKRDPLAERWRAALAKFESREA